MLMTITEYARHRGCQLRAVQYAVEQQRISRRQDGMIDSEQADSDWERNTNHAKARPGRKPKTLQMQAPTMRARHRAAEAAEQIETPEKQSGSLSYANARAAREIYEAKLKKIEWEEKLGTLVNRRAVEVAAFNRFRVLRDAVLNVPTRMAAQLAAETDAATVHEMLETELRITLEEFSGGKVG
jgi:hypothetical protein